MPEALISALAVAGGGAAGAVARWVVAEWVSAVAAGWQLRWPGGAMFPWGTWSVNLLGAFAIGFLFELAISTTVLPPFWRLALITGFVGGFTTFSTMMSETVQLLRGGMWGTALGYIVLSNIMGVVMVVAGTLAARLLLRG